VKLKGSAPKDLIAESIEAKYLLPEIWRLLFARG